MPNFFGALTDILTGGAQNQAADAQSRAVDALNNLQLPDPEKMKIYLQDLVSQGKITPEEANTYLQENTQLAGISTDPALQKAQMDALFGLQDISNNGGLTAQDLAKLGQIKSQEDTQARGAREAIIQNANARGVGGSGLELAAELQNQQNAATDQSQRDLDVGAMAEQRALQALIQSGQLGNQIQQTSFGQQAQVANAQDAINQFNTQNQQQQANLNTGNANAAQAANLANAQAISNANVDKANAQEQYNKNLPEVNFQNAYQKAGGTASALQNQAAGYSAQGANTQKVVGALGSAAAVGAAGSGGNTESAVKAYQGNYQNPQGNSDARVKEDIAKFDPSDFLDSLTSYRYHYKKPEMGQGPHLGIMAQDLEKTPEGASMVEDTPEGKKIDYGKGFGTILAALSDMHARVKELEGNHA